MSEQINTLPRHVAFILDGNSRWAKSKNKPTLSGHKAGVRAVRKTIEYACQLKIEVLTLYAFSKENWLRSNQEVKGLMEIFMTLLKLRKGYLKNNNIQIKFIGDLDELSSALQQEIHKVEQLTINNSGLKLNIAVNYSGKWDIIQATNKIIENNRLTSIAVDESNFTQYLSTAGLPEVDLLIRTSGEKRISNFFLWQIAYSELVFFPQFWPDFNQQLFAQALNIYQQRIRRFGKRV